MRIATISIMSFMVLTACGGDDTGGAGGAGATGTTSASGGGDIPCVDPAAPGDGRVACPGGSPPADTALPTLAALRQIAAGTGASVKWLGGILGQQIGRDGKPSSDVLTLWTAGFCLGGTGPTDLGDALNVSTNGPECLAQRQCEALDCSQAMDPPVPVVDADAAIATAFPSDPAGTLYGVSYTAAIGNYWTITSMATQTAVKIDAATGTVIP